MKYRIESRAGYIRAEMRERESAEETQQFVDAILAALLSESFHRVLISIRESRAIFKVQDWNLSGALQQVMRLSDLKVAFVSDSAAVALSQDYIALLARQRGLAFQAFRFEDEAIAWLLDDGDG